LVRLDSPTVEQEREHARLTGKAMKYNGSVTSNKTQGNNVVSPKAAQSEEKVKGNSQ
jgi:hypothetical protein